MDGMTVLLIAAAMVVYLTGVVAAFRMVRRVAPDYTTDNFGMALIGYVAVAWPAFAAAMVVCGPILALGWVVGWLLRKCTNEGER